MEEKKYLKLNDIYAYKTAFHLSNHVWSIVIQWEHFPKSTIGRQFANAMDSVSANIAEGFGRYFKKEKVQFYRIGKGSLVECFDWNEKARVRSLITQEQYDHILEELKKLTISINALIKYTVEKLIE